MKLLSLTLLIALTAPAFAGLATPSDEKAVLAAEKQFNDGMVKSDPATVAKLLADDITYFHYNGELKDVCSSDLTVRWKPRRTS
jgi:hypothetical protein